MDSSLVRNLLALSLEAGAETRRNAELQLKQIEGHAGFIFVLLDVLQNDKAEGVQLSAIIYIKNRVNQAWVPMEAHPNEQLISQEEKIGLKERILPLLAASHGAIRLQIKHILQRILTLEFPERWNHYMDFTTELLNTNDRSSVLTGIECLLAVCRTYRWKSAENADRLELDRIIETTFPRLLVICNELVTTQDSDEAGEMCHLALKVYKHAAWIDLSPFLRQHDNVVAWCEVFLRTVSKNIPWEPLLDEDSMSREKKPWAKAKKWGYFVLNRLFVRYGNSSSTDKLFDPQFAKDFTTTIAPEILRHYLQEVEHWASKTGWMSRPCISSTFQFLVECTENKQMWQQLMPHVRNLMTHFVFPLMCLTDEELELFDEEPEEFLHRRINYFDEMTYPGIAATNFLTSLSKLRRKETFEILKFVNVIVNDYESAPADKKNHVAKEGALRMIGTLAPTILAKRSPIAGQVEYFLVRYVFPDFKSPQGHLRSRACDTIEKFERLNFSPENLLTVYRNIIECLSDEKLPVRVMAALALQPLIRHSAIRTTMQQSIPTIMQKLLKLINETDVDSLANVMEDFVEVFSAELTPFAIAISEQLKDTYLRIVGEMLQNNVDYGDGDDEHYDDKSITALGVLQTIGTLILTLESTPEVLYHIEAILMPVIRITLENKLLDLYNEVFEIIDSCTFAAKVISNQMWQAFELMYKTFVNGGEIYLEDMLPALDNFVQFGVPGLLQKPEYMDCLYRMIARMYEDVTVGGVDRVCACKLSEVMMQSLRGHIDKYIPGFVDMAMTVLLNGDNKVKIVKVHLMEMVINAIYYNPASTLDILEGKGRGADFFTLWLSSISSLTRVHDKRLSIIAMSALLKLSPGQIPANVVPGYLLLLPAVTELFKTLPAAVKNRTDALKADLDPDGEPVDLDDSDEWDEDDSGWNAESEVAGDEAVDGSKDETSVYLDFLNQEAQKLSDMTEDEDFGEDSAVHDSPLDRIEVYQCFRNTILHLQQVQPQMYARLTSNLTSEQVNIMQLVMLNADHVAREQAAIAQQSAMSQQLAVAQHSAHLSPMVTATNGGPVM